MLLSALLLLVSCCWFFVFVFKQKTAYEMRISYWSSDVCSSDLGVPCTRDRLERPGRRRLLVCGERLGRILAVGEQRLGLFALRARNRQRDHGIFAEAEQLFLAVEAIFQPPE